MAEYKLDLIESLARQMAFTPAAVRDRQIESAETLLLSLEPAKAYPPAKIIFDITGYRAKASKAKSARQPLLTGLALQHDLGLLIEQVSDTLSQKTTDRAEPVLMIDDLACRFNVTSKTIQRWRRRGLAARRFVFPDAKRRIGFRLSVVERFLAAHHDCIERTANFSQIEADETAAILRHARRLIGQGCCVEETLRRIARRTNRSPLTIRATLQKADAEGSNALSWDAAACSLSAEQETCVRTALTDGIPLSDIARQLGVRRTALYRTVLNERLIRVVDQRVKFYDDPLYHSDDAEAALLTMVSQQPIGPEPLPEDRRMPGDLPAYLRSLYAFPLLSPARERALFLLFNYRKFCFAQARHRLDPSKMRWRDIATLEKLLAAAVVVKNQIVQANLRLVVSVAKKHTRPCLQLLDLVSEGNITLLRAVESFDTHKGNKFSTYATFALMKGYARSVPELLYAHPATNSARLPGLADRRNTPAETALLRDEVETLIGRFNAEEKAAMCERFGVVPTISKN